MEIKEVKEELKSYIYNKKYIEERQMDLERLEARINNITANYSDMPKSRNGSREDLIAKKLDLEREVYAYLAELLEKQLLIEKTLQKVEPKYRNILESIYIKGNTLAVTARNSGYSSRQCSRLLNEAYKLYYEAKENKNENI